MFTQNSIFILFGLFAIITASTTFIVTTTLHKEDAPLSYAAVDTRLHEEMGKRKYTPPAYRMSSSREGLTDDSIGVERAHCFSPSTKRSATPDLSDW